MIDSAYTVGIVVDTQFGNRIVQLAQMMPVWLVDSPVNRVAAEQLWQEDPGRVHGKSVTTFQVNPSGTLNDWCKDILPTVDLHHGKLSHNPPYSSVIVIGTDLSAELRGIFESYGFAEFSIEGKVSEHQFRTLRLNRCLETDLGSAIGRNRPFRSMDSKA